MEGIGAMDIHGVLKFATTYWIQMVVTGGTATIVCLFKKGIKAIVKQVVVQIDEHFKEDIKEQEAIKFGVLSLSHYILYRQCLEWKKRGEMTISEKDDLEHLYEGYSALGGNGTGTKLYEECKALPIREY